MFACLGVIGTLGHYTVLVVLVQFWAVDPVFASSLGFVVGAVINYILNYHFTFQSRKRHSEALTKFLIVAIIGAGGIGFDVAEYLVHEEGESSTLDLEEWLAEHRRAELGPDLLLGPGHVVEAALVEVAFPALVLDVLEHGAEGGAADPPQVADGERAALQIVGTYLVRLGPVREICDLQQHPARQDVGDADAKNISPF